MDGVPQKHGLQRRKFGLERREQVHQDRDVVCAELQGIDREERVRVNRNLRFWEF
jgi:hypothetical protein